MSPPPATEPNQYLPGALRALRSERGWSLDRAALETGVSKAMLGQIERGESSPTIATLWKIASGFHVSLSSFLEPVPDLSASGAVFRNADTLRHQPGPDGMLVAPLFPYEAQFGFELFELTLLPGYERRSEAHEPGVTESVIVLRGAMEVLIDGAWRRLANGEAVRFPADRPHGYRNRGETPAVFHNLIHYARPHPGKPGKAEESST
ncbi:helix-turn-helix domain-containing protein [Propionivibrio limicola]|uniref:helix-turn-helix domain-containing protein n=1 Tax=Propionivibrio limicola TaxID=167645 RepID=UPI00129114F6|nr:XRE family transcriptional regulator [Propionivibrio limicola]